MKKQDDSINLDVENQAAMGRGKRFAFQVLAVLSLGMAFVGLIVPGIPATEFILLCAWSSSKASPRIYRFLHENRFTGPPLKNWKNGRVITRKSKIYTTISMLFCAVILVMSELNIIFIICCIAGMGVGNIWIWMRPERIQPSAE